MKPTHLYQAGCTITETVGAKKADRRPVHASGAPRTVRPWCSRLDPLSATRRGGGSRPRSPERRSTGLARQSCAWALSAPFYPEGAPAISVDRDRILNRARLGYPQGSDITCAASTTLPGGRLNCRRASRAGDARSTTKPTVTRSAECRCLVARPLTRGAILRRERSSRSRS